MFNLQENYKATNFIQANIVMVEDFSNLECFQHHLIFIAAC